MSDSQALQETGGDSAPVQSANVGRQIDRHEKALLQGDLSELSNQERKSFYAEVCESLGLNPMTQPLEYIWLSGDLTLYANKTAANQLRDLHGVSITDLDIHQDSGLHTVYAYAEDESGRTDVDAGIVDVSGARGEALANAKMKAITKAKRRVTLSICGLGFLDETEVEDIPDGATEAANVDPETGEIRVQKPDNWYREAIEWLASKAASKSDLIDHADQIPAQEHPLNDWPEKWWDKAMEAVSSGKETREPSAPRSQNQKSAPSETKKPQSGGEAKASEEGGGSDPAEKDFAAVQEAQATKTEPPQGADDPDLPL